MTLQQLQYALMLQKHRSFKVAAHKLLITQPGLSLQIAKLEKNLGILLFDRSKNPINPTDEGLLFLTRAQEIVLSANNLSDFAKNLGDNFSGKLSLGIIPTLAPFLVPLFSSSYQDKYTNIALDINEITTESIISEVRNGQIDAGIISTPIKAFGLSNHILFYEKFYFYKCGDSSHSKISLSKIDYSKLWLLNEGNCFRDQINNFCNLDEIRKNKKFIYRSNSIDALIRIVDSKGGMTIVPELSTLILTDSQMDNIHQIEGNKPKAREISLITRSRNNKESIILSLVDHIKSNIPKSMLSDESLDIVDPNIEVD